MAAYEAKTTARTFNSIVSEIEKSELEKKPIVWDLTRFHVHSKMARTQRKHALRAAEQEASAKVLEAHEQYRAAAIAA